MDPFPLTAKVAAIITVFPYTGLLRFLHSPKTQIMFHTEHAGSLSKSAGFVLQTYASLVMGGLQGGRQKPNLLMGAACALCRNAPNVQQLM